VVEGVAVSPLICFPVFGTISAGKFQFAVGSSAVDEEGRGADRLTKTASRLRRHAVAEPTKQVTIDIWSSHTHNDRSDCATSSTPSAPTGLGRIAATHVPPSNR